VVADALSRKNTILLTRIDRHILRLDEIKDLYPSDPFFGEIFAKCSTMKGPDDRYLHKSFLFKANKLCVPESSLSYVVVARSTWRRTHGTLWM
jgi:hypothetical protein